MDNINKDRQERKVFNLEMGEHHEYFGSSEQLLCKYNKEQLGLSIYQVRNNPKKLGKMDSPNCTITVTILQTKLKQPE